LLDDFKTKILSNLRKQVEMLRMQDEEKAHAYICVVHAKSDDVKYFPSLPKLKEF